MKYFLFLLFGLAAFLLFESCSEEPIQSSDSERIIQFQSSLLKSLVKADPDNFDQYTIASDYKFLESEDGLKLVTYWDNNHVSTSKSDENLKRSANVDNVILFFSDGCTTSCTSTGGCANSAGCDVKNKRCTTCWFGECTKTRTCPDSGGGNQQ